MVKLFKIEGIGEAYEKKLNAGGLFSIEDLLEKGATPKGRKEIAAKTGINEALILKWPIVQTCSASKGSVKNMVICWKQQVWILSPR